MAIVNESNLCLICNRPSAICVCIGCKQNFCSKDFKEHEQQLSVKFDHEIVSSHDELLNQMQNLEKSNYFSSDLFDQIEQWKKITIKKVKKAAKRAHHQLTQLIDKQRIILAKQIESITKEIHFRQEEENFVENDIVRLKQQINEFKQNLEDFTQKDKTKIIVIDSDQIDWNQIIHIREEQQLNLPSLRSSNLSTNTKWIQNGVTVAGRNERGSGLHQLSNTWGLCVDDDQTIYIADSSNYRLVEWKCGATAGQVVAGGNKHGNHPDQLSYPADVIIDIERDSFIISDYDNKRVVRWPRHNGKNGETIISNVGCWGLAMDNDGFFYIVDSNKQEVRRYRMGESQGTLVAGGNGQGNRLDQ
ncbi:unnamed protein product, partial [Rotaria sp. Silwood2]